MVSVQLHLQIHPKMDTCMCLVWGEIIYSDPSVSGLEKGTNRDLRLKISFIEPTRGFLMLDR